MGTIVGNYGRRGDGYSCGVTIDNACGGTDVCQ